jgi:hypothetical protein
MPHDVHCTRADPPRKTLVPFAALPHDIAADPRLSPTDVRTLLALPFWARSSPSCWPSDHSIAARIGRSVGTVQRSLRRLVALGLVERQKTADNPTGRLIVLRWRSTPVAPTGGPPVAPARDESRREGERRTAGGDSSKERSIPPAGEKLEEPPASADDLTRFQSWADGPDPVLARLGRSALKLAGVVDPPAVPPPANDLQPASVSLSEVKPCSVVTRPVSGRCPSVPSSLCGPVRRRDAATRLQALLGVSTRDCPLTFSVSRPLRR